MERKDSAARARADARTAPADGLGEAPREDSLEAARAMAAVERRLFPSLGDTDPVALGRFEVRERVGSGGMGVVYDAWDPDLGRRVAVKVVRPAAATPQSQAKLLAEARQLARVQHPNVVTILDVGRSGDRVFIAMEFIETTLERRLRDEPSVSEILAAFRQAGEGLAAAHAVGLIHRDFKPANVLLRPDGQAVVADFGLARPAADLGAAGIAGTPFYMSPEQHDGLPLDARSDQYSFCVALYEALTGEHPYGGETADERRTSVAGGRLRRGTPGRVGVVPVAIARALRKGLRLRPDQRFDDMRALLDAMFVAPGRRRRRWALLGAGVAGFAVLGIALAGAPTTDDPCATAATAISDVWSPARRWTVARRFEASELAFADDASHQVLGVLDDYAQGWTQRRVAACEATVVPDRERGVVLDLRIACLDDRRARLAALVDELSDADADVVQRAAAAVHELPSLAGCDDDEALARDLAAPEDPEIARQVADVERRLAEIETRMLVGRYRAVLAQIPEVRDAADATGYAPTMAAARRLEGQIHDRVGEHERGAASLEEAAHISSSAADDEGVVWAAMLLVRHAAEFGDPEVAGGEWARLGEASLRRLGSPPRLASKWRLAMAVARARASDLPGAVEAMDEAIALADDLDPRSPARAKMVILRATLQFQVGQFDAALEGLQWAREVYTSTLGTSHPDYATVEMSTGNVYFERGDHERARTHYLAALKTMRGILGPDSTQLADLLYNVALVDSATNRLDDAAEEFEQVRRMYVRERGADHAYVGAVHDELAEIELLRDRPDEAARHFETSLRIKEAELGSDAPQLAKTHRGLGKVALAQHRPEDAVRHYERARELTEAGFGPDSDRTASAYVGVARAAVKAGQLVYARQQATHALQIYDALPAKEAEWLAHARFVLAQATWDVDPARARELAIQARSDFSPGNVRDEADAWLAAHGEGSAVQ